MIFPYFELAASLFILLLAFQIWTRHYENAQARFFASFALVAFAAAILEYSSRIAFTLELGRDLDRLCSSLWAFVFPLFAHFAILFTRNDRWLKRPLTLVGLYLPAAILTGLFLLTDLMFLRFEIWPIGIVSIPSAWYGLFMANSVIYSTLAVGLLFQFARRSPQKTERASARLIAYGVLLPLAIGLVTDEIVPLFWGTRLTAPTAVFDLALLCFFIFLAMRRYALFAISPALAAETIIETMPDSLIVTDLLGRIIFINEEARQFFHVDGTEVAGQPILSLFKRPSDFHKLYEEVVQKKVVVERYEAELIDKLKERIPALVNARLLREKVVGEVLGIVFVVRDIRG